MKSSEINLVMTVVGFGLSIMFIVFVCTRLICARIQLTVARRSLARSSRSDLSILERGCHGVEPRSLVNFPTKKYRELCLSSKENDCQRCTVCLADYQEEDTLSILPVCGHSFHATCISIWLQQNSTCPVCRVSLRDLPERRWFMQPIFSPALRFQYHMQSVNARYCHCMANGNMRLSRQDETERADAIHESDVVRVGDSNSVPTGREKVDRKVESPSS